MTDHELAEAINSAVAVLNGLISRAYDAGLMVELDVVIIESDEGDSREYVEAKIGKSLL